ncbi:hypothetical protein BIW11_06807 [Tropilaelaps mercedesae]|uniref:Uncharacterized protein n=1 Tax=Tropilaelaps mercedesae TaxID=418985 RepID=A0A1V9XWN7_9ACAR|nr:hypothetical protein BIW11_06807 [Tropilaelaps mercedesae]
MRFQLLIAIGCVSFLKPATAQGLLGVLRCGSDSFTIQQTCPLHCDLALDTFSCSVCVCPPCIICPEPCYFGSFSGGLHGECPGCAPINACRFGFFRSTTVRRPTGVS